MKFAVGFQLYDLGEEPFSQIVSTYRDRISEVFFSWQDTEPLWFSARDILTPNTDTTTPTIS